MLLSHLTVYLLYDMTLADGNIVIQMANDSTVKHKY